MSCPRQSKPHKLNYIIPNVLHYILVMSIIFHKPKPISMVRQVLSYFIPDHNDEPLNKKSPPSLWRTWTLLESRTRSGSKPRCAKCLPQIGQVSFQREHRPARARERWALPSVQCIHLPWGSARVILVLVQVAVLDSF